MPKLRRGPGHGQTAVSMNEGLIDEGKACPLVTRHNPIPERRRYAGWNGCTRSWIGKESQIPLSQSFALSLMSNATP